MCCGVAGTAPISTCITTCTTTTHLDACTICTSALPPLWWVSGWQHIRVDTHILQLCLHETALNWFLKATVWCSTVAAHFCACIEIQSVCDVGWRFLVPMMTHNKATVLCMCVWHNTVCPCTLTVQSCMSAVDIPGGWQPTSTRNCVSTCAGTWADAVPVPGTTHDCSLGGLHACRWAATPGTDKSWCHSGHYWALHFSPQVQTGGSGQVTLTHTKCSCSL